MSKSQNKKSKFRSQSIWKNFRKQMKDKNKVDLITGKPLYKGWNLHHLDLDENHYQDISNDENFACLNKTTHECVHWLFRYENWEEILENLKQLLFRMDKLNKRREKYEQ